MTFKLPVFAILKVNAYNLAERFSTRLGRYEITPDHVDDDAPKKNTLELLIPRAIVVGGCETDRITQREVFNQLVNELREVAREKDEKKCQQGALFLLGALLHRYFRLIKEYDSYNDAAKVPLLSWSFFSWDIKRCRLFTAIREALRLPRAMPANYKTLDLEALDATTVVTALECFQSNMLLDDRYKNYPHFVADLNFKTYLQDIITEHRERGVHVFHQFKAINFLNSLVKTLDEQQQKVEAALDAWAKILKKEHVNFSQLSAEAIESHIVANIPEPLATHIIEDILLTGHIQQKLSGFTHESFISEMKEVGSSKAGYIVLGGCSLLLETSTKYPILLTTIYEFLKIELKPQELTTKNKLTSAKLLSQFIEGNPDLALDTEYFGGSGKFKTKLLKLQEVLTERNEAEQEAEPSAAPSV